jgi:hypothetical protein
MLRRVRRALDRLDPVARRDAWSAWAWSRLVVLAAAAIGATALPYGSASQAGYPGVVHPFGGGAFGELLDFLFSPFIRGDATWYLLIADQGYTPEDFGGGGVQGRPAFFPLYPMLIAGLGGFADLGLSVVVACVISLAALLGALYLLHRLTALELGEGAARATVRLLAFSPVAFFFSAPYTESLFLLLSVASLYAARRDRWALAGVLAALASATRNVGALLIVPLAIMYLYRDGRWVRPRPSLLWVALAPAGVAAFSAYLKAEVNDLQAWRHAQVHFGRPETVTPLETIDRHLDATVDAIGGSAPGELHLPIVLATCFLVFAAIAVVGVFRSLPIAYGAYSLCLLVPALTLPLNDNPLGGFPRYTLVVFPLFMWLGLRCERSGWTDRAVLGFTALLAVMAAAFASWQQVG